MAKRISSCLVQVTLAVAVLRLSDASSAEMLKV
jgi:hypothetical protein